MPVEAGEADAPTLQGLPGAIASVSDRLSGLLVLTPQKVHAPGGTLERGFGPPAALNA